MLQYLPGRNSCTRIHIEYQFHQAPSLVASDLLRDRLELSTLDFPEEICLILCEKGQ